MSEKKEEFEDTKKTVEAHGERDIKRKIQKEMRICIFLCS